EPRQLLTAALDTKFGDGGVENLGLTLGEGQKVRAHAMLPDGKIIIAGLVRNPTDSIGFFPYVMRLLPNGTPDASFGAPVAGQPGGLPKGIAVFTDTKVLADISQLAVVDGGEVLLTGFRNDHATRDAAMVKLTS